MTNNTQSSHDRVFQTTNSEKWPAPSSPAPQPVTEGVDLAETLYIGDEVSELTIDEGSQHDDDCLAALLMQSSTHCLTDQIEVHTMSNAAKYPWRPGVWALFPHRAFWSVVGCISAIAASTAVLVVSDGQPTENWTFSPTVYIAIFTTALNLLAKLAFRDGLKTTWWRKALHGATIGDLHTLWSHGDGFWPALLAGKDFNLVTLASLAATCIVIDQPLIQRASRVIAVQQTSPVTVRANIAPEIPWGFTSFEYTGGFPAMTSPMIAAYNAYADQGPIVTDFTGCEGTCSGFIDAGGLAAQCNSTTGPIRYLSVVNSLMMGGMIDSPFLVSFGLVGDTGPGPPQIPMKIAFSQNANDWDPSKIDDPALAPKHTECFAVRTERLCSLVSATVRYPVTLTNYTITLGNVGTAGSVQALQAPNPAFDSGDIHSRWTLGGIYLAAEMMFAANATYSNVGKRGMKMFVPDTLSSQFLDVPASQNFTGYGIDDRIPGPSACASTWKDPTSHILSELNTLAFLVSLQASTYVYRNTSSPPPPQTVTMEQTRTITVYQTAYGYMIGSVVLSSVLLGLIVPTLLGWWELGRPVSLHPIETAKGFDAPVLRGLGSNAPLDELVKLVGNRKVRWGEVELHEEDNTSGPRVLQPALMFASPDEVASPRAGSLYT